MTKNFLSKEQRELVNNNRALVFNYIKKYPARCNLRNGDFDDKVSVGMEALCIAALYFDKSKGYNFSTYAMKVLERKFQREKKYMNYSVSVSARTNDYINKLKATSREDLKYLSTDDIIEKLGCTKTIAYAIKDTISNGIATLQVYPDTVTIDGYTYSIDADIDRNYFMKKQVAKLCKKYLTPYQMEAVFTRYGIGEPEGERKSLHSLDIKYNRSNGNASALAIRAIQYISSKIYDKKNLYMSYLA